MATADIYLEKRQAANLISDMMRHWHARHANGKALVVTDDPATASRSAEKQWLRLTQALQQQRAEATGAQQLLELTYRITRMQQTTLSASLPSSAPGASMWFVKPAELTPLPASCRTVYLLAKQSAEAMATTIEELRGHAMIVDYCEAMTLKDCTDRVHPKSELEAHVHEAWQETEYFLSKHNISIAKLSHLGQLDTIDDTLDALLDVSGEFLRHAYHFQEALQLAEPLALSEAEKQQYETVLMLARRVSALSPSVFGRHLKQTFETDPFTFYDGTRERDALESLVSLIARHRAAGRLRLARALEQMTI